MEAICKTCGAVYGLDKNMPKELECFSCEGHDFELEK